MEWIAVVIGVIVILALMALPRFWKDYQESKKTIRNLRDIQRLNDVLVSALFEPAISSGWLDDRDLEWRNESCSAKSFSFRNSLGQLSEFYIGKNDVLAAGLWGVWSSVDHFAAPKTILEIFRHPTEKKDKELLFHYRTLAATAAIQFADGSATTVSTKWAVHRLDEYKEHVDRALEHLRGIDEKCRESSEY